MFACLIVALCYSQRYFSHTTSMWPYIWNNLRQQNDVYAIWRRFDKLSFWCAKPVNDPFYKSLERPDQSVMEGCSNLQTKVDL